MHACRSTLEDPTLLGPRDTPLDDPDGARRTAVVQRTEGLDGWSVFIRDSDTQIRISSIRTLSGTKASVRLDTVGQNDESGNLRDGTEAVIEPPADYVAVPRYVTRLTGGAGLGALDYPSLPTPVKAAGQVANRSGSALTGFPARVTFESNSLFVAGAEQPSTLLHYVTSVSTDDSGRFATVLPPGAYYVTIEPVAGTGFAIAQTTHTIVDAKELTLLAEPTTKVRGVAVIADGRPLTFADVVATPDLPIVTAAPGGPPPLRPRPARARTDETGGFALELDPGAYVVTVVPQPGTGFPRLATRQTITPGDVDLGTLKVPPPIRLQLEELREPNGLGAIVGAQVRVYGDPTGGTHPVEIGNTTTGRDGQVEILLAPNPR